MSMSEVRALVAEWRASKQARADRVHTRVTKTVTIERETPEDQFEEEDKLRYIEPEWEDLSEERKEAKLTQWRSWGAPKPRRNFDPIRAAFLEDWRETSSGCEIWWPI